MRELIERFSYRYQLWREERESERWGPDPAQRNPLRYVAGGLLGLIILTIIGPFIFHRPLRVIDAFFIPAAVLFLILYSRQSRWAWHTCVAWVLFTFFIYWTLWLSGYSPYQARAHESILVTFVFHAALCAYFLVWLFRRRDSYFRYIAGVDPPET